MSTIYAPATYKSELAANIDLGPCMKALNPREQALVFYLIDTGTTNWTKACEEVGYTGGYDALRVTASRKRRDPRIGLALREVGSQVPNFDLGVAMKTIREIAADPSHKDAGKMALALAGMAGVSPIVKAETVNKHVVIVDPIASIEAKLALLPPDVADNLRRQLLPPDRRMIDVTPARVSPEPVHSDPGTEGDALTEAEAAELLKDIFG
jgi:hypothetical protein